MNFTSRVLFSAGLMLGLFCLSATNLSASLIAADQADDAVYNNGWQTGDNGGTGWGGGWTLTNSSGNGSENGHFIGDSTTNGGNLGPGINTSGEAWGMYSNSGQTASAVRPFNGAMNVTETFSIDMDNGFIQNGGTVGFGLQNSSGNNVWEFFFTGGNSNYTVNAGSVSGTTPGFTDRGLSIDFSLISASTYAATITRLSDSVTFNVSGNLLNPSGGQAIDRVRLFSFNAGSGGSGDFDAYFNSIAVPEPSSLALAVAAAMFLMLFRTQRI